MDEDDKPRLAESAWVGALLFIGVVLLVAVFAWGFQ